MALVDIKFHEVLPPEILFFVAFCFFCHKNEPGFFLVIICPPSQSSILMAYTNGTHTQLKELNLKPGSNEVQFSVTTAFQGTTRCK